MAFRIVGVGGSLTTPSKSNALVRALAEEFSRAWAEPTECRYIELAECGGVFSGALSRASLPDEAEALLSVIEGADLLVVGSPVYHAGITGLFKHVFDFIGPYALVDKPVLLSATGGSDRHTLVLEYQLRPLFAYFQTLTLPLGVYGTDHDFENYQVSSIALRERITRAVARGIPVVRARGQAPAGG